MYDSMRRRCTRAAITRLVYDCLCVFRSDQRMRGRRDLIIYCVLYKLAVQLMV
jgi:hypothetical protein